MRTETEWRTWMFSVASRRTCCDADAEDIVQDVLLRFWVSFGVLPWEHSESQWARVVCQRWIRFRAAELWRSASIQHECALDELAQVLSCSGEDSETHLVEHTEYQLLLQNIAKTLQMNEQGEIVDCGVQAIQLLESTSAKPNLVRIESLENTPNRRTGRRRCILRTPQQIGYEVRRIPDRRR